MDVWGEIIVLVSGTVLIDRLSKALAIRSLAKTGRASGRTGGFLQLVTNERPLFVRVRIGRTQVTLWALAMACALAALAANTEVGSHNLGVVGFALALGGAASNLRDRLTRGSVIDFIAIGWWPVFNLADVAIVAGAAIAVGSLV